MKLKTFLKKIWNAISSLFEKLEDEAKVLVPIAINVVEAIKNFELSTSADVIEYVVTSAIPGDADDLAVSKGRDILRLWLPKILLELNLVNSIANIEDTNEQLIAILAQLKMSSDETQNIIYHGLSSLIIEKLSDGKFSWSDAIAISEYYYINVVKK